LNGAIFLTNNTGDAKVLISGNRVETNFNGAYDVDGIEINLCRTGSPFVACAGTATATIDILGNTVLNTGTLTGGADGIDINLDTGAQLAIAINNNTVTNFPDKGISFGSVGNGTVTTATIASNVISNMGDNGIHIRPRGNSRFAQMTISGNQVSNVGSRGIDVRLDDDGGLLPANTAIATVLIENNTVTGAEEDGIRVRTEQNGQLFATVRGNTISNSAASGDGGFFARAEGSSRLCLRLERNTSINSAAAEDFFLRNQATLQLFGISAAIAVGNPSAPLQTALTAQGNVGRNGNFRTQNNPIAVPTAACTFP